MPKRRGSQPPTNAKASAKITSENAAQQGGSSTPTDGNIQSPPPDKLHDDPVSEFLAFAEQILTDDEFAYQIALSKALEDRGQANPTSLSKAMEVLTKLVGSREKMGGILAREVESLRRQTLKIRTRILVDVRRTNRCDSIIDGIEKKALAGDFASAKTLLYISSKAISALERMKGVQPAILKSLARRSSSWPVKARLNDKHYQTHQNEWLQWLSLGESDRMPINLEALYKGLFRPDRSGMRYQLNSATIEAVVLIELLRAISGPVRLVSQLGGATPEFSAALQAMLSSLPSHKFFEDCTSLPPLEATPDSLERWRKAVRALVEHRHGSDLAKNEEFRPVGQHREGHNSQFNDPDSPVSNERIDTEIRSPISAAIFQQLTRLAKKICEASD